MANNQTYTFDSHFHFSDCDPAGIFYFGNVPDLCHRVYENWLTQLQPDWQFWFNNLDWALPIKNCTTDFISPMKAGSPFRVQLNVGQISQSSFTTQFHAYHPTSELSYFKTQIVHVFVNKKSFEKCPVPVSVRQLLEPYLISRSL